VAVAFIGKPFKRQVLDAMARQLGASFALSQRLLLDVPGRNQIGDLGFRTSRT
jgi:hypothetical protein